MENERSVCTEFAGVSVPDRLRWMSDFLEVAGKAIAVVACVSGVDYPPDLHRSAQQDLLALADYLASHPAVAADFEWARIVCGESIGDGGWADWPL